MKKQLIVRLNGIHCGGCISRIEQMSRSFGATAFQIDYATMIANIDFPAEFISANDLCDAIRKAGYWAAPIGIKTIEDEAE